MPNKQKRPIKNKKNTKNKYTASTQDNCLEPEISI